MLETASGMLLFVFQVMIDGMSAAMLRLTLSRIVQDATVRRFVTQPAE